MDIFWVVQQHGRSRFQYRLLYARCSTLPWIFCSYFAVSGILLRMWSKFVFKHFFKTNWWWNLLTSLSNSLRKLRRRWFRHSIFLMWRCWYGLASHNCLYTLLSPSAIKVVYLKLCVSTNTRFESFNNKRWFHRRWRTRIIAGTVVNWRKIPAYWFMFAASQEKLVFRVHK